MNETIRPARLLLIASLVMVAFNLRPALSSLGPVLPEALAATGLSTGASWLLTTVPVICFGLFGLAAPRFARPLGLERAVLAFLLVLAAGMALRGLAHVAPVVLGGVLAGAGIGVLNVLMPGLVKRDFPQSAAFMTGLYTMALCVGGAIGAGATAPLEAALEGGWAWALAFWSLPALAAAALWWGVNRRAPVHPAVDGANGGGLWRDPLAWQVTLMMGLQSSLAYCVLAWLAPLLRERGLSPVEAGLIVSGSILVQAPAALVAPMLATRGRDQRAAAMVTIALTLIGLVGMAAAPLPTLWAWAVVQGIGQGALFAVALTVIVLRTPDGATAARLSSMAQGVGYSVASVGPLLMGALRGATGGWTAPVLLFVAIGAAAAVAAWGAGRNVVITPRPALPKAP